MRLALFCLSVLHVSSPSACAARSVECIEVAAPRSGDRGDGLVIWAPEEVPNEGAIHRYRCLITKRGEVTRCRSLSPAPPTEDNRIILEQLARQKFTPLCVDGEALDIEHTFHVPVERPAVTAVPPPGPPGTSEH